MIRLLLLLPLLIVCACTSLQGQADDLARRGLFVEAAEIYAHLARNKPEDPSLAEARDELRWRALEQLLGKARRHRLEGDDEQAEQFLQQFLDRRAEWGTKLNGALESSLLEEMEGTHLHFRRIIVTPARSGYALTAEEVLGRKLPLLAHRELAPIRREVEGAVLAGGKASCARLKQLSAEGSPHWAELVARYCLRWNETAPEPPPPAELLGAPLWTGSIEGIGPEQLESVKARLSRVFEASPWYSPRATRQSTFTLHGGFSSWHVRDTVRLTAPWVDQEPYTHQEERTETYQEPYTEEEEYTENGETKKRTVTKYREKTRSYTVPVTRYRDIHKTFEYTALRHSVTYRFAVAAAGTLVEQRSPFTAMVTDESSSYGYEHDISFPPGGISPQRAHLREGHDWFSQQVRELERRFAEHLSTLWIEYYCVAPALTLEEAARCARIGAPLPAPARQALGEVLGEDAPRVPLLFSSTPVP